MAAQGRPPRGRGRLRARTPGRGRRWAPADSTARRHQAHGCAEGVAVRAPVATADAAQTGELQLREGGFPRRPRDGGRDGVRGAGALQAGRADLDAGRALWRDHDQGSGRGRGQTPGRRTVGMSLPLESTLEALLFLSPEPVPAESLAESCGVELHEAVTALERLREHYE